MAAKSPNHPPLLFLFWNAFLCPLHLLPHPPPTSYPSSLPLSFVSHFSHLTYALTQNNRISFTSNSSQTYKKGQRIQCHKRVPRTQCNYTRASFRKQKSGIRGKRKVLYTYSYCTVRLTHLKTFKRPDQESCRANLKVSKELLHTLVGDVWTTEIIDKNFQPKH